MSIFDAFKKKKKIKRPKDEVKEKKPPKVEGEKKVKEFEKEKPPKAEKEAAGKPKKTSTLAYQILKTPHVTEKATDLAKKNQYIFKVWPRTNKIEIKKAIEDLYGVDVMSVRIIKVPSKRRKLGKAKGWRKGYKKAIVRIKEGKKIEVLPR